MCGGGGERDGEVVTYAEYGCGCSSATAWSLRCPHRPLRRGLCHMRVSEGCVMAGDGRDEVPSRRGVEGVLFDHIHDCARGYAARQSSRQKTPSNMLIARLRARLTERLEVLDLCGHKQRLFVGGRGRGVG